MWCWSATTAVINDSSNKRRRALPGYNPETARELVASNRQSIYRNGCQGRAARAGLLPTTLRPLYLALGAHYWYEATIVAEL
jgi:hypothetical protein